MIENEYLSIAQEMKNSNDFVGRKVYFYNAFEVDPRVKTYHQPPLVSYQILAAWKLLGENLWGARLVNVLFGTLSILVIYFISFLLFSNVRLALFCALLLSIMPLGVFFSRNLQPDSPALFFMLLGNLFYLRFASSLKKYNLLLGGLAFSVAWVYRPSFIFGMLPFIFYFPFANILRKKKEILRHALIFFIPYLVIPFVIFWLKHIGQWEPGFQLTFVRIAKSFEIFHPFYWQQYGRAILWFVARENYTLVFSLLCLLGIMLAFIKGSGLLNRYIIGWAVIIIPFSIVFSEQIYQQSFAQMPFLGMVCVSATYIISFVSQTLRRLIKRDTLLYLMIVAVLISLPFVYRAIQSMHATVFLGEDVAGGTLRELTAPGERVFLFTHSQGYGIARYAQRYSGWPVNLADFKEKENKFKIRYLCVYPPEYLWILEKNSPELFKYIQNNYHVKELGLLEEPDQLVYFILEKGKGQNIEDFLKSISGEKRPKSIYRLFGRYVFFYTLRPDIPKRP